MPSRHICNKHHADLDSAGYCCYKDELVEVLIHKQDQLMSSSGYSLTAVREIDEHIDSVVEDNTRWVVYSSFYGSYMKWTPNQFMNDLMPAKSSGPAVVYGKKSAEELARKSSGVVRPYVETTSSAPVIAAEESSDYW